MERSKTLKVSEENYILLLKNKNEQALDYVVEHYGWIIKGIVKKQLYNLKSHQEECINDILLGIWNNIDQFDENKNAFKNWVAGISKYKTIDCKRKYLRDLEIQNIDDIEILGQDNTSMEVLRKEIAKDLEDLLGCLKRKDKEIFTKLYIEGCAMEDVSKLTGLTRDVIYNRVSRGKRKLKKMVNLLEGRRV